MSGPDDNESDWGPASSFKAFREAAPFLGAGLQMAAAVVLMFFAGRWLDAKFGTDPWLMLAGMVVGAAGGLYAFIRTVSEVDKAERKTSERK